MQQKGFWRGKTEQQESTLLSEREKTERVQQEMTGKEATKIGSTADSKQNAETVRNLLG